MKQFGSLALLGAFLLTGVAQAEDESLLAQKSGCLSCHKGVAKGNGPAYKDVAGKYAGKAGADRVLAERIVKGTGPGGQGWMDDGKATMPFMPPNGHVSPRNAAKLARWILTVDREIDPSAKLVSEQLSVSGLVEHKVRLAVADLEKYPLHRIEEIAVLGQNGVDHGKLKGVRGVLLKDILAKASIMTRSHNDVKKMAVVATATDDYRVVFSYMELFNSPLGDGVLVFFEKDGAPLGDDEGRIALVSTGDTRTGPRHVKWLKEIEVRKVVE